MYEYHCYESLNHYILNLTCYMYQLERSPPYGLLNQHEL